MNSRFFLAFLCLCSSFSIAQKSTSGDQIKKTPYHAASQTEKSATARVLADQVTVDFEKKAFMLTETTSNTDGCRKYKDYSFRMVLSGGAPTAPGTAILQFGGTATEGVDYKVTTNQNFASPSTTLTFPAGNSSPASFTVRVYDDTTPEDTETIVISYALNNNGGNLFNGQTAQTLTIKIQDNDLAPFLARSGTVAIGGNDDLASLGDSDPLDPRVAKRKVQLVYTGEELRAAGVLPGNLTSLAFFILEKKSTRNFKNLTIKLVNASADHLLDSDNFYSFSEPVTVYSASQYNTIVNWNTFTFSSPFAWTGSNLGVEICYDNGTADAAQGLDKYAAYTDHPDPGKNLGPKEWNMLIFEGLNCNDAPTFLLSPDVYNDRYRPQVQLGYSSSGISVQTTVAAASSNYVPATSTNYFYSNTGNIIGKISSANAQLGCVSFFVEEAGTTWVAASDGSNRSRKTFLVTPAEGASGTTYSISFFLTTNELGGNLASSVKLAKTTASSASAATTSNTIMVTPTITAFGTNAYQFTANFTGFSRFFLVQENALPVTLTNLKAIPQEPKTVSVQWTTTSETNFDRFELEHSLNPREHFKMIATLPAGQPEYSHQHLQPSIGTTNYYRLKMIDRDGSFAYSKLTSALIRAEGGLTISPNPAKEKVLLTSSSGIASIRLLSIDGRIVLEQTANGANSMEVTLPKVSTGLYFVQITTRAGTIERKKIIVE